MTNRVPAPQFRIDVPLKVTWTVFARDECELHQLAEKITSGQWKPNLIHLGNYEPSLQPVVRVDDEISLEVTDLRPATKRKKKP